MDNREPLDLEKARVELIEAGIPHDQIEYALKLLSDLHSYKKPDPLVFDSLSDYRGFSDVRGGNRHERRTAKALARKKR